MNTNEQETVSEYGPDNAVGAFRGFKALRLTNDEITYYNASMR